MNGSQLYAMNASVTSNTTNLGTVNTRLVAALGGGSALDGNGVFTAPSYTIGATTYDNIGAAFAAVNSSLNGYGTLLTNLQTTVNALSASSSYVAVNSSAAAAVARGSDAAALGGNAKASGNGSTAIGASSTASAINGSAIGSFATASAASATAVGTGATASGIAAFAGSSNAKASGDNSIALGSNAQATQSGALAFGLNAAATGTNAIAIGAGATATGSVAVGMAATASNGGAALGDGATATGANAAALGPGSTATANNSVAIGYGSAANTPNTISVGSPGNERRITNVAAGVNPTDAVNVGQLNSVAAGFQSLQSQVASNQIEARRGIAAAVSLAPVMMPSAPGKTIVAVNAGFFRGETGVGVGFSHRLNFGLPTVIYGSYSNGGGGEHIGRAGLAMEF